MHPKTRTVCLSFGLAIAALVASSAALATQTPQNLAGVKVVTAAEVQQLQAKGVPLIDARVAAEYADKTIKGAVSVPYKEKSEKAPDFDRKKDTFDIAKLPADKNAPLVFFCNSGECWKSYKASVIARDAGYKQVYWFRGGFPEWSAAGLPTQ